MLRVPGLALKQLTTSSSRQAAPTALLERAEVTALVHRRAWKGP